MRGALDAPLPVLARRLRDGDLDLAVYLDALEAHFAAREHEVLAFVPEEGRFDRLRRDARALLDRFPETLGRPALFGLPFGVKDIFHVDGLPTTAGSRLPPEVLAGPESEVVTRLTDAGALVLGKTVSTEFAAFAPGPTRNPVHPAHTPGGSSSGSAAAVGAGLAPFALGTQTIGSIGRPASYCGVVGFKPSYDRLSRAGVIPLAPSADHVGYFTRDAASAALIGAALLADDSAVDDIVATLAMLPPVIGVPQGPYLERAGSEAVALLESACQRLERAGYTVKRVAVMGDFAEIERRHRLLFDGEMARVHATWYPRFGELYHPKTREIIERGRGISEDQLEAARAGQARLRAELEQRMREHGVDLWIAPSATGTAPLGLDATGDPIMNLPWTHAGLPALTLPAGLGINGLPVGVQLVARFGRDRDLLLHWAEALEAALGSARASHG